MSRHIFCLIMAASWPKSGDSRGLEKVSLSSWQQALFTWVSSNWSPPNADTHGLMPPVPRAIKVSPIKGAHLFVYVTQIHVRSIRHHRRRWRHRRRRHRWRHRSRRHFRCCCLICLTQTWYSKFSIKKRNESEMSGEGWREGERQGKREEWEKVGLSLEKERDVESNIFKLILLEQHNDTRYRNRKVSSTQSERQTGRQIDIQTVKQTEDRSTDGHGQIARQADRHTNRHATRQTDR